jgi:hypothetical protein
MGRLVGVAKLARRRRDEPDDVVEPAVIVSFALEDRRAPGCCAGQPQGRLDGLGARAVEAHAVGARDEFAHEAGGLVLDLRLGREEEALVDLRLHGADHLGRVVPEDHGPHAEIVVDQPVAVGVENVGALGVGHDKGRRRDAEAEVAADAPGHQRGGGDHPLGRAGEAKGLSGINRCI